MLDAHLTYSVHGRTTFTGKRRFQRVNLVELRNVFNPNNFHGNNDRLSRVLQPFAYVKNYAS